MFDRLGHSTRVLAVVSVISVNAFAQANAGVSDERVNLPEAPGSIDGVGENATSEGNQGALSYQVKVEVPQGFPGLTPQVNLNYSSSGGSDVLGIGWSMSNYSIERMTSKGLQEYATTDRFVVEGSEELVALPNGSTSAAVYRSRFERGFVRYTWRQRGTTGEGGYWTAEYPDGRIGFYGADAMGNAVAAAQVVVPGSSPQRVFRWHLVTMLDRYGHSMNLTWTKDAGGVSLLDRVDYLYDANQPRHSLRFVYEARPDFISDARPGFEMRLTQRLKEVRVLSGSEVIRAYVLTYEAETVSGGASRLARVNRLGRNSSAYPVVFNFGYSKTLGGACDATCEKPFVRDMGTLPNADFSTGRATLIDMNGDALPDVVYSNPSGVHSFYYARLDTEGRTSFAATAVPSTRTTGSSPFILGTPAVQVLDVNGDGFVDITQPKVPAILCNDGSGDWVDQSFCAATAPGVGSYTPEDDSDQAQVDPRYVRFFDYDNDKRIDWLRTLTGGTTTEVLANTTMGFQAVTVQNIGAVFDESTLQLADMNGDGLQDPVQLVVSGSVVQVQYKLNLGFGRWTGPDWTSITLTGLDPSQASVAELQDINGDTLSDVVVVTANEVKLAINRNGNRFDAVRTITTADLGGGAIPSRATGTVVSYADMNGNGSDDIVWFQPNGGQVAYLELFPVRPNLLARIDNGIGAVQRIAYGTSIVEQARDTMAGNPWLNKVPNPMTMVKAMETFVTLTASDMNGAAEPTGLRERISFRYSSGYYDGIEKQFRGYESVERQLDSDMSRDAQEPGLIIESYDVGKPDTSGPRPLFAGLKLRSQTWGGTTLALLQDERSTWEACPVEGVTTRFACQRVTTTVHVERDAANAVTTQVERDYDGFGNITKIRNLGVKNLGTPEAPRECAPCKASGTFGEACGTMCTGDEQFAEYQYLDPGTATNNLWLIGWFSREAHGAVATLLDDERRTYYDGTDFEGLPLGQLTRGGVSRVERRVGSGATDFITIARYKRDTHGNVVESILANGTVADATRHRRLYTMEPAGLHLLGIEVRTGGTASTAIKRDFVVETAWEKLASASAWYAVNGSTPLTMPQLTRYRYDEHGRLVRQLEPGDSDMNPSVEYQFSLADPSSRVLVNQRSTTSSGTDIVTARCLDGKGRVFQRRSKLSNTSWQVDGFVEFDARGQVVRRYLPYRASSGDCETMPPANVPSSSYRYDALGRLISETHPDGKVSRSEFGPLVARRFNEEDSDAASPFANTPEIETFDGLGRLTSLSRLLQSGGSGTPAVTRFEYDGRGMLSVTRDASGNAHTQTYDLAGRLVRIDSTNGGSTVNTYDAAGNKLESVDGRNVRVKQEFDGADRIVARYDAADPEGTRVTWAYDRVEGCAECTNLGNRLARATWPGAPGGEDRFGYDAKGNVVYSVRSLGGHDFVVRRRYDQADREVGVTYADGTSIDTTYDGAGRPVAISGAVERIEYTDRGELGQVRFLNGVTTDYTYDTRVRLASIATQGAGGEPLLSLTLSRSGTGNVVGIDDGALAGRARHAAQYTVDAWGRLTRAVLPGEGGDETLEYGYDAIDNLVKATSSRGAQSRAHVGDLAYDAARPNAVSSAGALALTYDGAGGMTGRGSATFTRDYLGRITGASGRVEGAYTWDASERVAKQEGDFSTWYVDDDFEVRDGIAVVYARIGETRVARLESDALAATVLSDLAPATGAGPLTVTGDQTIDIADAWLAQAAGLGLVQLAGGPAPSNVRALLASATRRLLVEDVTYLQTDHLRSLVLATSADGKVRGEQSFYPTGSVRQQAGYVDSNGFTGQEFDEATGLIHFRYRELDPFTGRWDRPDPAFAELSLDTVRYLGQSTTAYAYVANAFNTSYDPTGLNPPPTGASAAAAASGGAVGSAASGAAKSVDNKARLASLRKTQANKRKAAIAIGIVSTLLSIGSAIASFTSDKARDTGASWGLGLSLVGGGASLVSQSLSASVESDEDKIDKIKATMASEKDGAATTTPAKDQPNATVNAQQSGTSSSASATSTATATASSGTSGTSATNPTVRRNSVTSSSPSAQATPTPPATPVTQPTTVQGSTTTSASSTTGP